MTRLSPDNQHYTPQLLLKGFTLTSKPKMTFRYKKGERVREKSIRRVASEDNFYRVIESDNSVDEANTEYENTELKTVVETLREIPISDGAPAAKGKIERAVLHLWARSRHFRDALSSPLDTFLTESADIFGSSAGLKSLFLSGSSQKVDDELYTKFIEMMPQATSLPKKEVLTTLRNALKENPEIFVTMAESARAELDDARQIMQPSVKSEHINFLTKHPEIPKDRFKDYNWFLWSDTTGSIVFPDCVLLSYSSEDGFKPLLLDNTESQIAVLPISSHRLLVGTTPDKCPDISIEHIVKIGRCAFDFFIHPEKKDNLDAEKEMIGVYYEDFSTDVVSSALSDYRPAIK